MKTVKLYTRALLIAGLAFAAVACDENAWNNELDGFEELNDQPITDKQTIEYTLTDADYSLVASNSTNKALAGDEGAKALAAVGTAKQFSADAKASEYIPAFLASTSFPYYTLSDGSAVKVTYRTLEAAPEEYTAAQDFQTYTVPADVYKDDVWKSDDYVEAFSPLRPAADFIPTILADYVEPDDGMFCIVSYKMATQEPVFGSVGGSDEPAGPFEILNQPFNESLGDFTIENKSIDEHLSYVWSWGGANYGAKATAYVDGASWASESWLVSPVLDFTAAASATMMFEHVFNKFPDLEFAKANCTLWGKVEGGAWAQIAIPECTDNTSWTFTNSGEIDLTAFAGKKAQIAFKYVSEDGKSGTWEVKNLLITGMSGAKAKTMAKATVPTETMNAVYQYNNGTWAAPKNFIVLDPADYTAMGQSYANLSVAEPYLSTFLNRNYAYAAKDDVKYIYWLCYAGGTTSYRCSAYAFDGNTWAPDNFVVEQTDQFVRTGGKWNYCPDVTITLPAGKGQPLSTLYFQTCVDWVYENICVPLGDTSIKSGNFYVTSYGNNEYYSGTSAYQGNVDLRASAARAQYPAEYKDMTDEEIVALEKSRFMNEVMPGALGILHSDAKPLEGVDVLYTINFAVYNGTTTTYTAIFKVVAPGKFAPVSCTWDAAE